jgi:pilus assembly protein CpaC
MAISGQEGKFLAGGIVFLPIPQSSSTGGGAVITLQQQPYGVGIKFTPTVLRGGKINLKVSPEVSEVNPVGITVSANGSTSVLPSINTRQASTTVQLNDGQSFAIGGLIKNNVVEVISAFPWLANIPILGALFRSSSFQNDRSELLIIVTPRIVQPVNTRPMLPTDKYIQPTEGEFLLNGQLEGNLKSKNESKNEKNIDESSNTVQPEQKIIKTEPKASEASQLIQASEEIK